MILTQKVLTQAKEKNNGNNFTYFTSSISLYDTKLMINESKIITYLKWSGTLAVIVGVFLAAIDIHPWSSFTLMTASALWFGVGISWKEYAIVTTNICTFSSSVLGLLIYYV